MNQSLSDAPPAKSADPARVGAGTSPITAYLEGLRARLLPVMDGAVASYIPELAKASPDLFGVAIATTQGAVYAAGDTDAPFTIQSVSKPFAYGDALRRLGREAVLERVGVEPTGEAFNAIILDEANNRPFNPMVNAGAIAVSALIPGKTAVARRRALLDLYSRFAGRPLRIDEAVYRSEDETGHRNRAIAYMMLNSDMLARPPEEALATYFQQCSIEVTCADLAVMAATLANNGVNPLTGETVLDRASVRDVLSVMMSCGMYDYAGQWAFEVGLPAKSGVSGAIIAVVPGQIGLAAYSPPVDAHGNSVRGVAACKEVSCAFGLHVFGARPSARAVVRRAYRGDVARSRRQRPAPELAILEREGRAVAVFELQGALYFGSAERLVARLDALEPEVRYAVIDFRRVRDADAAAIALLRSGLAPGRARSRILLCGLEAGGPLAALREAVGAIGGPDAPEIHADLDAALDWCESALLGRPDTGLALPFDRLPLFSGLDAADIRSLEAIAETLQFEAGEPILRAGETARLLFVVARGSVSVNAPDRNGARLAAFGPGAAFGEMALLDGGPRSADVVADTRVLLYGFSTVRLREIAADRPGLLVAVLSNLARELSERLRLANRNLVALD